jgi:hypothetical protein
MLLVYSWIDGIVHCCCWMALLLLVYSWMALLYPAMTLKAILALL